MPKRANEICPSSDSKPTKPKKRRIPVSGESKDVVLSVSRLRRINMKTDFANLNMNSELTMAARHRTPITGELKRRSRNLKSNKFIQIKSINQQAFRTFKNSIVGKISGVPDFDATIRKSFDKMKLKRTVYLGSKSRCLKIRYKVLWHLVNMSVQLSCCTQIKLKIPSIINNLFHKRTF